MYRLWAKTDRETGQWHGLAYHLLDVAAAAEALWARLPQASRRDLDPSLVTFLAASHDVGKANGYFQGKAATQRKRLEADGFVLPSMPEPQRHGQATGAFLKEWLKDRWGWQNFAAECIAKAVGGHHGRFFEDTSPVTLEAHKEPWSEIGSELLDTIAELLKAEPVAPPEPLNPFLAWLAGFVSVSDWLGSHESMTVWETSKRDLGRYLDGARDRAAKLLDMLDWALPAATPTLTVADLVPEGALPNQLQMIAGDIADSFEFAIVEAPTGEGKTEAAFALAESGRHRGAGAYFALPTMATANGLHARVHSYLSRATNRSDLDTRLLHSMSWLYRENATTVWDPGEEGAEQEAQAQDWFEGGKRGLLAPYAVGTIDQILIAALRAKHGFVRLFALAGKVVIVDEVHAYDVYMSDLLEVLLGWLRALGCRVVLLSATLPSNRRAALLAAWGHNTPPPASQYPCITWSDSAGCVLSRTVQVRLRKPLTITPLRRREKQPVLRGAEEILRRVQESGGLGALVLNTVRDVQDAFQWLTRQAEGSIDIDLFHARFTAEDRARIEKHVLREYGKSAPRKGPRILVATQVVEQSLDLDFDHMVSALAPVDLLIQRAGRLHRHTRFADGRLRGDGAQDGRPNPELLVLCPEFVSDLDDPVYSHDVLLRTLAYLTSPRTILSPDDLSQAIENVYSEGARALVMADWEEKLKEFESHAQVQANREHRLARKASIAGVGDTGEAIVECTLLLDENDERYDSQLAARTRLEERPSMTLAILRDAATTIHGGSITNLRDAALACVRCTPPYSLWKSLLEVEPIPQWRRKGALAHARPLISETGVTLAGEYVVSYDSTNGLEWRKPDADV